MCKFERIQTGREKEREKYFIRAKFQRVFPSSKTRSFFTPLSNGNQREKKKGKRRKGKGDEIFCNKKCQKKMCAGELIFEEAIFFLFVRL